MQDILVVVSGGIVQAVYTRKHANIEVIDGDVDGLDGTDTIITRDNGEEYYVYQGNVNAVDSETIDKEFARIKKAREE